MIEVDIMSSYAQKMDDYSRVLKRRMVLARFMGIMGCCVGIACIVLYAYFHNEEQWQWLCLTLMAYSLGTIFMQNCNLQAVKVGNPWQRVNGICAMLMYALDIAIITYALATGKVILW